MSEDLIVPSVALPVEDASTFHGEFHTSRQASAALWKLLDGRPVVVLDVHRWVLDNAPDGREHYGLVADVGAETDDAIHVARGTSARKAVRLFERAEEKRADLLEARFQSSGERPDAIQEAIARLEERALARGPEFGVGVPLEDEWLPKSGIKTACANAAYAGQAAPSERGRSGDGTQTGLNGPGQR